MDSAVNLEDPSRVLNRITIKNNFEFDPSKIEYVVACSGGNDSICLAEHMIENYPKDSFLILYNDTGWARKDWPARMQRVSDMLKEKGVPFVSTISIGFEQMVREHKGFPMPASAMQFCTQELKTMPTLKFLKENDPNCEWTIVTGRRREESNNRAGLAMYEYETSLYEGRDVFNPLIMFDEKQRDEKIHQFGLTPLPHSSMECFPCVCSNKDDLVELKKWPGELISVKNLELEMGHTRNGKPRVMFRPYRAGGGVGIENVIKWAEGKRGTKIHEFPKEYMITGVDYSGYRGNMTSKERVVFWAGIKEQCVALGHDLTNLPTDIAYDDTTSEGVEFSRQCDGGLCGN
jgi:3'-phosphoadenosine 5'-phosphosulfate sulfotransferase (PAPS reductase)/FAD synthetase